MISIALPIRSRLVLGILLGGILCAVPAAAPMTIRAAERSSETETETETISESIGEAEAGTEEETEPLSDSSKEAEVSALSGQRIPDGPYCTGSRLFFVENGVRVRAQWRTIDGHSYFFGKNGAAMTGLCRVHGKWYLFDKTGRLADGMDLQIVTVRGRRYFADVKGHPVSGWQVYNGQLYYARPEAEGFTIAADAVFDKISFDEQGRALESTNRSLKLRTREIISQITTPDMDRASKLRASWNYVCSSRFSYFGNYPDMNDPNWPRQLAWEFFSQGGGNCYGFAVSFCALAHEIGYDPVVVHGLCPGSRDHRPDGLTRHCCLSIDGLYYDPEGTYAGWAAGIYGTSYSSLAAINGTLPF